MKHEKEKSAVIEEINKMFFLIFADNQVHIFIVRHVGQFLDLVESNFILFLLHIVLLITDSTSAFIVRNCTKSIRHFPGSILRWRSILLLKLICKLLRLWNCNFCVERVESKNTWKPCLTLFMLYFNIKNSFTHSVTASQFDNNLIKIKNRCEKQTKKLCSVFLMQ